MLSSRLAGLQPMLSEELSEEHPPNFNPRASHVADTKTDLYDGVLDGCTEQQVTSMLQRMHREREKQLQRHHDPSDDEQAAIGRNTLIDKLGGREEAAIVIQRAFRAYVKRRDKSKYMSKQGTIKMADYFVPERFYTPKSRFKALVSSFCIKAADEIASADATIEEEEAGEGPSGLPNEREASPALSSSPAGGAGGPGRRAGPAFGAMYHIAPAAAVKETGSPTYLRPQSSGYGQPTPTKSSRAPHPPPPSPSGGLLIEASSSSVRGSYELDSEPSQYSTPVAAGGGGAPRGSPHARAFARSQTQAAGRPQQRGASASGARGDAGGGAAAAAAAAEPAAEPTPDALASMARNFTRSLTRSTSGRPLRPSSAVGAHGAHPHAADAPVSSLLAAAAAVAAVDGPGGPHDGGAPSPDALAMTARSFTRSLTHAASGRARCPSSTGTSLLTSLDATSTDPNSPSAAAEAAMAAGLPAPAFPAYHAGPPSPLLHHHASATAAAAAAASSSTPERPLESHTGQLARSLARSLTHSTSTRNRCAVSIITQQEPLDHPGSPDAGGGSARGFNRSTSGRPLRPSISGSSDPAAGPPPLSPLHGALSGQSAASSTAAHAHSVDGLEGLTGLSESGATLEVMPEEDEHHQQHRHQQQHSHSAMLPSIRPPSPAGPGGLPAAAAAAPWRGRSEAGGGPDGGVTGSARVRSHSLAGNERGPGSGGSTRAVSATRQGGGGGGTSSSHGALQLRQTPRDGGDGGSPLGGPSSPLVADHSVLNAAAAAFLSSEFSSVSMQSSYDSSHLVGGASTARLHQAAGGAGGGGGGYGRGDQRRVSASTLGPGFPSGAAALAGGSSRTAGGPPVMVGGWVGGGGGGGGRQSIGGSPLGPASPMRPPPGHPPSPTGAGSPGRSKKCGASLSKAAGGGAGAAGKEGKSPTLFEEWKAAAKGACEDGEDESGGESFLAFVQRRMAEGAKA